MSHAVVPRVARRIAAHSTGLTLLLMSPACYAMLARVRTSVRSFLWALFTVSLSFFLASFQGASPLRAHPSYALASPRSVRLYSA